MYGHELPKTGFSGLIYLTVALAIGATGIVMKLASHLRNH
jgi:hypothetical protein